MKRIMLLMAVLGALATTPALAAQTYFGFQIGVTNAPPPPRLYFREAPQVVFVPETRVYVVRNVDYDMFRYGRYWYVLRGGYWYRAPSYRGPFRVVDARYVPRPIYYVPAQHWKHRRWDRGRAWGSDWHPDYDRDDRTYFGFHVNIMNAPPPPVLYFRGQPDLEYVPEYDVYVVRDMDYDMFRYGGFWYVSRGGYWYRSDSYRGPFRAVSARQVPESIYSVPARHWKHWRGDPDRNRGTRDGSRDRGRDRDRGRNRG